jgi:hypothetical protein
MNKNNSKKTLMSAYSSGGSGSSPDLPEIPPQDVSGDQDEYKMYGGKVKNSMFDKYVNLESISQANKSGRPTEERMKNDSVFAKTRSNCMSTSTNPNYFELTEDALKMMMTN